ncbi:nucleosome-remodeling factor subunit NURF301-like [Manduca sexta]|uniref:nucleosome-remodeling factor subunit NURF301-like n=1 Tax=Manduca sexta TaxID=7130 RepID=UPI00188DD6CF|nr:nucleosome-remodeling factor subunit NURF301-like [Manduca sexta]
MCVLIVDAQRKHKNFTAYVDSPMTIRSFTFAVTGVRIGFMGDVLEFYNLKLITLMSIYVHTVKKNSVNFANMKELTPKDFENLKRLVKQIQLHKNAWPFMEPVDPREAPTYYKVIKEPMDLQTVERKVNEQIYSTLSEFIGDMTKIFDNCRYFNPKDSEFYRCADGLEAFLHKN